MSDQHKNTQQFFDEISADWFRRAYDPNEEFGKFPTSRLREELTVQELEARKKEGRVVDLGCGTGALVHLLSNHGFTAVGVDNAPGMIAECKKTFPEGEFIEADVDHMQPLGTFDAVTAMGLLEYLEEDEPFFDHVAAMLNPGGYAFIECRSRLFNTYSANAYTKQAIERGELVGLLDMLHEVDRFSPVPRSEIQNAHAAVLEEIKKIDLATIPQTTTAPTDVYRTIPDTIVRRQHTPAEVEISAKKAGLTLEYVVYYHAHPYPPAYAQYFPQLYHRLAYAMQPLGRTPLGAAICSSFVAILKK